MKHPLLIFVTSIVVGVVLLGFVISMMGCEVEGSAFDNPHKLSSSIQYIKGPKGNCFAVVGARKTGSLSSTGIGMAWVPKDNCSK